MSTLLKLFSSKGSLNVNRPNNKNLWWFSFLLFFPCKVVLAETIFADDFESGNFSHNKNGARWSASNNNPNVSTERPRTGEYSARFLFEGVPDGKDSFSELRFILGGNYDDVWLRYDLFIPNNYYHRKQSSSTNNKFLILWSGDYSHYTGPGLSIQNWDTGDVGESKAIPKAASPANGGQAKFSSFFWKEGGKLISSADRGRWMTIVVHAKYATSSNNDGVFQLWKIRDGETIKVFDKQDGDWYVPGQPGFDKGYLLGWSNSGFDEDTVLYIDNVEIATHPLLDGINTALNRAAPKPPVIIPE